MNDTLTQVRADEVQSYGTNREDKTCDEKMKTLPFMSEELKQFLDKFPELKPAVSECVKNIVDVEKWETVMSDFAYKPASKYPRTVTIKHTCKKKSTREKVIQSFSCSWKPE